MDGLRTVRHTRVACCQVRPEFGDLHGNRGMLRAAVDEALSAGAQLIVLPELASSGYTFRSRAEVRDGAQPASGGVVADWISAAAASGCVIVGGFAELGADGEVYNAAAVVDCTGLLAVYRKTHLWDREPSWFARGDETAPVVQTSIGRIGVIVCYDLFFPEFTRTVAAQGAEIIVVPTNSPTAAVGRPDDNIGVSIARSTAHVNRVFVAVCDRWGVERDINWVGRSLIADPDGDLLAPPPGDRQAVLLADCDLSRARDKTCPGTANDVFDDLRPELYQSVART